VSDAQKKTPLHATHLALGAKMVPFAGYGMPLQYSGIISEHNAVRTAAGLFDVSHMGEFLITGNTSGTFVNSLVTNDVSSLYDGKALYTAMCREDGGIIDDLLVYRFGSETFVLVVNASRRDVDLAWVEQHAPPDVTVQDVSDETALLALQGPRSFDILRKASGMDFSGLKFYHFERPGDCLGSKHLLVSRTGYTGETGVELYCPSDEAVSIWERLMEAGQQFGLLPAGLGARDTLRLEAGFCLYGNDLTTETNPLEAGLGWLTKLEAGPFVGRDALLQVKKSGPRRKLVGFIAQERGIPRADNDILAPSGDLIGAVTSGSQSPVLGTGIGMGYVENNPAYTTPGATLQVSARGRTTEVKVARPPFHVKRTEG